MFQRYLFFLCFCSLFLTDEWAQHKPTAAALQHALSDSLTFYLNSGYPFAKITLDSPSGRALDAHYHSEKGPYVKWAAIVIKPDSILSERSAWAISQLQRGAPFSEKELTALNQRFSTHASFRLLRPIEWALSDSGATVYVYLERIKASNIRGLVGIQPNPITQKTSLTGEMQLRLQNSFQKNEKLEMYWRSIKSGTQQFQTRMEWPYIAGTPFGCFGTVSLYKRDSSFFEAKSAVALSYQLPKAWQFSAGFEFWSASRIAASSSSFSKIGNFHTLQYTIAFKKTKLDQLANPRKGYELSYHVGLGQRSDTSRQFVWKIDVQQVCYQALGKRQTLRMAALFQSYNCAQLYQNELFRFGGFSTLRGFNEEELFASTWGMLSLEYRFLLDQSSHLFVFGEAAYYENRALTYYHDFPRAVGFGLSAGTAIGIFRITYAVGQQFENPFSLATGKIHMGYIAYF
ncbi:MAG: hypothetical protein RLZZ301_1513 [Bacteroidota bacterium]|jgi:outer membrane translocation and assembly module TamA